MRKVPWPSRQFLRRLRRILRARALGITYAAVGVVVAAVGSAMLFGAHASRSDILVNVGSNLVDAVVFFAVITPIVALVSDTSAKWNRSLDFDALIADVRLADRVDIMETWTPLLDEHRRARFLEAVAVALDRGAQFRIVLLDPSSTAAKERDRALERLDVLDLIRQNIRALEQLRLTNPRARAQIQVKISNTAPLRQMYRYGNHITFAYFPTNRASNESPQDKVTVDDNAGDLIMLWFEQAWMDAGLVDFDDFLTARTWLPKDRAESRFRYVQRDTEVWLDVADADDRHDFDDWRRDGTLVRVSVGGDDHRASFTNEEPDESVHSHYRAKYGPTPDLRLIAVRLPVQRSGD